VDPGGNNSRVCKFSICRLHHLFSQTRSLALLHVDPASAGGGNHRQKGSDRARISLGIGPISFPGYLDRQEIVTRVTQNQIGASENDRWAEPLDENFARVLAQNLSALLGLERIHMYPWPIDEKPSYQVEIEVLGFEANAAGDVQLLALWAIRDTSKKVSIRHGESHISRSARTKSAEAVVAAHSEALGEFSREIAGAVRAIEDTRQPIVKDSR
jgi:uncharacterized lipoprotein YmbA